MQLFLYIWRPFEVPLGLIEGALGFVVGGEAR